MLRVLAIMLLNKLIRIMRRRHVRLVCTGLVVSSRAYVKNPSKLMIVAHPDDESIFGGEALLSCCGWTVVCVTGASNARRRNEFMAAMHRVRANYTMLDHADEADSGNFDPRLEQTLIHLLAEFPYELIVTHNRRGEYGHPQHRALHRIVRGIAGDRPVYVFETDWWAKPRLSVQKELLLKQYRSEPSVRYFQAMAARETLKRIQ
jgi:LmbE family N-acetylglucosaminyl deacetylase